MQNHPTVCSACDTQHAREHCPVCRPGRLASAVDFLFGFTSKAACLTLATLAIGTAGASAQMASSTGDPTRNGPEITDVYVKEVFGGFQSRTIFFRTPVVGWPHRLNGAELRSVARGVRVIHSRVYLDRGLPRGGAAVCGYQRGRVQCVIRGGEGRPVAWYPVRRMWEDGSVSVFLPLAPSMSVALP